MSENVEVKTRTALHVIKGAVVKVLGKEAIWTASTYVKGNHGRLTVKYVKEPTPEEMRRIEEEANRIIQLNQPVETITLPREKAEEIYGKIIYDLFPIPSEVKQLQITIIKDPQGNIWNINACNKKHTKTTAEIRKIKIRKPRYRKTKQLLEIPYDIEP